MPPSQSYGRLLGRNISAARGRLQLTQTSVAARMQSLGFDWHQQTAANVEKGKRRVTAEELLALAYSLETSVATLERPTEDDNDPVELPAGGTVSATSVRHSVAGRNDGEIKWSGNEPVFPGPGLTASSYNDLMKARTPEEQARFEEIRSAVLPPYEGEAP